MFEHQKAAIKNIVEAGRVVHQFAAGSWGDSVHRVQLTTSSGIVVTGEWATYQHPAILAFEDIAKAVELSDLVVRHPECYPEAGILAWSEYWQGSMPRMTIFTSRVHDAYVSEEITVDWTAERLKQIDAEAGAVLGEDDEESAADETFAFPEPKASPNYKGPAVRVAESDGGDPD